MATKALGFNDRIPDEISIAIFRYLDLKELAKLAEVCKKWRILSSDDSLWKGAALSYKITPQKGKIKAQVLKVLLQERVVEISDKKELMKMITALFKKSGKNKITALKYKSAINPRAFLYAVVSNEFKINGLQEATLGDSFDKIWKEIFAKADSKLYIKGKDDADYGRGGSAALPITSGMNGVERKRLLKKSKIQNVFLSSLDVNQGSGIDFINKMKEIIKI